MTTMTLPIGAAAGPQAPRESGLPVRRMLWLGPAELAVDALVLFAAGTALLGVFGLDFAALALANGASSSGHSLLGFLILIPLVLASIALALVVLACLPWLLRGYAWIERQRAARVYGIPLPGVPRRRTSRRGIRAVVDQWWLDASDTTPWRGLAFLLSSLGTAGAFGIVTLGGVGGGIGTLITAGIRSREDLGAAWQILPHTPVWLITIVGIVAIALGLLAAMTYPFVDRALVRGILGGGEAEALRGRVGELAEQRAGAVAASAQQRSRIERDLHDDVQPRLVSIAMTLGMAQTKYEADPAAARELLDQAHAEAKETITELRRLVQGLQPAVLADRGLDAALSAIAARCPVPVTLDVDLPAGGCSPESEAVVYFAVSEALTNAAKHAGASRVLVQVARSDRRLIATITDDGRGGAALPPPGPEGALPAGGLAGMRDRAVAAGGVLRLASPVGGPTTITVEVPCAS